MRIAITGATGFLGRYLVARLAGEGHTCLCWYRPGSDRSGFDAYAHRIEWIEGELGDVAASQALVAESDAVIHAALYLPGKRFQGGEGNVPEFVEKNVIGTLHLIEAAWRAEVQRFVFISTCAVHDKILDDRPLDETHPTWAMSHYGAHKAAIEQFIYSYGLGRGFPICGLRPTGIYGLAHPPEASRWFDLVEAVAQGRTVECHRGGKEVHAADVAKAAERLLTAEGVIGQVYNCYDRYISDYAVATHTKRLTGSAAKILGQPKSPKHQIVTDKLRHLGMSFGGEALLARTVREMVEALQTSRS